MDDVTITLTWAEAVALLYAYDINEFPVSNPLGREGYDVLESAEAKLRKALGGAERITEALYD